MKYIIDDKVVHIIIKIHTCFTSERKLASFSSLLLLSDCKESSSPKSTSSVVNENFLSAYFAVINLSLSSLKSKWIFEKRLDLNSFRNIDAVGSR